MRIVAYDPFGNHWIPTFRCNETFNSTLQATWLWFMQNCFDGLFEDIEKYVEHIETAVKCDYIRWVDEEKPYPDAPKIANNSDMQLKKDKVIEHLNQKIEWLKEQLGDFSEDIKYNEPERDTTPAAPLPDYAKEQPSNNPQINIPDFPYISQMYNLQGVPIQNPIEGEIYVVKYMNKTSKILYQGKYNKQK